MTIYIAGVEIGRHTFSCQRLFQAICHGWGCTRYGPSGVQIQHRTDFFARSRNPQIFTVDVLVTFWDQINSIYVFPSQQLLPHLLHRIKMGGIPVILIAPKWLRPLAISQWALPSGPSVPRAGPPSYFFVAGINGMAVETQVLRINPTILKAEKSTSRF